MKIYHVIKNGETSVFSHLSPALIVRVKKLCQQHDENATYEIRPPVCDECLCPILMVNGVPFCQCEPEVL